MHRSFTAAETEVVSMRPATPADLPLLQAWDRAPHVLAAKGDEDWGWATELARQPPWREQLIARWQGRDIGFVQIIDPQLEDEHYWGECEPGLKAIDIWIGEADLLGQGLGTAMMRAAIQRCFDDRTTKAIVIDPLADNLRARRFYERLGFAHVEDRCFGDDACAVYRLELQEWERSQRSRPATR